MLCSLIDPDVVDHERLVPGVEPLLTRLPELPSLGLENQDKINSMAKICFYFGVVAPGSRGFTSLVERPATGLS